MKANRQFSEEVLLVLREAKDLRIRAGNGRHRFISIWFVLVEDRVFVRSWSLKPNGWYRTFLREPRGAIQVANYEIPVRVARIRSRRLLAAIDRAYLERYNTKGAIKYAKDLGSVKSRAATLELLPRPSNG